MHTIQRTRERKATEPTLGEELAAFENGDVVEMTNLQEEDTGVPGVKRCFASGRRR